MRSKVSRKLLALVGEGLLDLLAGFRERAGDVVGALENAARQLGAGLFQRGERNSCDFDVIAAASSSPAWAMPVLTSSVTPPRRCTISVATRPTCPSITRSPARPRAVVMCSPRLSIDSLTPVARRGDGLDDALRGLVEILGEGFVASRKSRYARDQRL